MRNILFALMFILMITSVSATFSFSNYADFKSIGEYGTIDVWNGNLIFADEKVASHTLIDNTDECLIDCHATGTTTLYTDGSLFEEIKFLNGQAQGSITLLNGESYEEEIPDFKQVCLTNKNGTNVCTNEQIGTHQETRYRDGLYKGETLKAGTYEWRIDGKKAIQDSVDWIATSNNVDLTEWAWWSSSWLKKKEITLTENNASALTNYTLLLNITYDSNVLTNFGDLRFTESTETTEIPYWIESNVSGSSALVWVKIPSISASGTATIYMYYNNSAVSTTSSLTNAWDYANDFSATTDLIDIGNSCVVSGIGITGGTASGDNECRLTNAIVASMNTTVFARRWLVFLNITTATNNQFGISFNRNVSTWTATGMWAYAPQGYGAGNMLKINNENSDVLVSSQANQIGYQRQEYKYYGTNMTASINTTSWGIVSAGTRPWAFTLLHFYHNTDILDKLAIGKFVAIEPTYSFGAEQNFGNPISITTTLISPANNTNQTSTSVTFSANTTATNGNITNMTLYLFNGGTTTDIITGLNNAYNTSSWAKTLTQNTTYKWNVYSCGQNTTASACAFDVNRTITIHNEAPTITILYPNSSTPIFLNRYNIPLNFTITDSFGIGGCGYAIDGGTNKSLSGICNGTSTTQWDLFNTTNAKHTLVFYANDTLGNTNTANVSFFVHNYTLSYSALELEGINTTFYINIQTTNLTTYGANLTYNNSVYPMVLITNNFTDYKFNRTIVLPYVSADTKKEFGITYYLDGVEFNTSRYNQTIGSFAIDNCSGYTNELFNITIYDEDSVAVLGGGIDNVTIEASFTFKTYDETTVVLNYSNSSSFINPFRICLNNSLGSSTYRLDGVIGYESLGRFKEFYNLQNYTLTSSTSGIKLILYDLNSTTGQEFKITYKDSNFVPVSGAIIDIQRKYISEGLYRTVERPKTGIDGYTVGHFLVADAIYNILLLKEGVTLATFNDVVATCQNPALETCQINLNSLGSDTAPTDYSNDNDLSFSLEYNESTRIISSSFSVVSGGTSSMLLNVTLYDSLGTTSVCTDSLTGSGGSLSCTIPSAFGNSTVLAKLYKDGNATGMALIKIKQDPTDIYGGSIVLIAMLIFLTIVGIGATSDSPMVMGLSMIIGSVVLVGLNIVYTPSIFGVGATILWFVILIVLVLIKGGDRQ